MVYFIILLKLTAILVESIEAQHVTINFDPPNHLSI